MHRVGACRRTLRERTTITCHGTCTGDASARSAAALTTNIDVGCGAVVRDAGPISLRSIFDIKRLYRYIAFIAYIDMCIRMKQVLTHSAHLGQILAARRRAAKLSQRALATKLSISQNRLSEIEANPGTLTVDRLLELANLLGLELVIQDRPPIQLSSKAEW
jgi:HTH-type transcriptional regulator/antitoxin HipB